MFCLIILYEKQREQIAKNYELVKRSNITRHFLCENLDPFYDDDIATFRLTAKIPP